MAAAFFAVGAPAALLIGYLCDKFNRRNLLFIVVLLGARPCICCFICLPARHASAQPRAPHVLLSQDMQTCRERQNCHFFGCAEALRRPTLARVLTNPVLLFVCLNGSFLARLEYQPAACSWGF